MKYRCGTCGRLEDADDLKEFPFATIFERPMRFCKMCGTYFETIHTPEAAACSLQFRINMNLPPSEGLARIGVMADPAKGLEEHAEYAALMHIASIEDLQPAKN